jgi:hypothetical protein
LTSQLTQFHDRHLSGRSTRSSQVSDLVAPMYDYILLGSSWDKRCLSLTTANIRGTLVQLFVPRNRGVGDLRQAHDDVLSAFAAAAGSSVDIVTGGSEELEDVFHQIEQGILDLRKDLDRPLRMLVDLSAMPRYFSLGALALGLDENVAESVDVFYAEGTYGQVVDRTLVEIPEYTASWEAVAVPRLEGDWYPSHQRHFVVSVGFEAAKVARLAERWDPDVISVLFPSPGIKPEYETEAGNNNAAWMAQFGVGESDRILAPPADAIAVWSLLSRSERIDSYRDNVYCLLCGTKPHALGMALYSLSRERPAVMYVRPTMHEQKDISPNGTYWCYSLTDRTVMG